MKARFARIILWFLMPGIIHAQDTFRIAAMLQQINRRITADSPRDNGVVLLSNRAMNLFIANKAGYYLSGYHDLSYAKNDVTFDAAEGILSLNHNLYQAKGDDRLVRSFTLIGVKANVADAFAAAIADRPYNNDIGATVQQTFLVKPGTHEHAGACRRHMLNNKQYMDAVRTSALIMLEQEISKRSIDFEHSLSLLPVAAPSQQDTAGNREVLRKRFDQALNEEYALRFASLQTEALMDSGAYHFITTSWTTISAYVPAISRRFLVAGSLKDGFASRGCYPLSLTVSNTHFLSSPRVGIVELIVSLSAYLNNTAQSGALKNLTPEQYRSSGGIDTLTSGRYRNADLYIGAWQSFITPRLNATLVWFPGASHVGLSIAAERDIGRYNELNGIVGIPIVLIDKRGAPAANVQFQIRYADLNDRIFPDKTFRDKMSVGLTLAVPFSKIIY